MQLLIVHRDPEMGEALVQMITNYTGHHAQLVESDKAAMDWARRHQRCELLLIQLEAEGIDGLALGSSLSEIFPGLQVIFFPNYSAASGGLKLRARRSFRSRSKVTNCSTRSSARRARRRIRPIFSKWSMSCKCVA